MIAIRPGRVPGLRRRGRVLDADRRDRLEFAWPNGFDVVEVRYADRSYLCEEIAGYAADAVVLEPTDLRAAVIHQLRTVAATRSVPHHQAAAIGEAAV